MDKLKCSTCQEFKDRSSFHKSTDRPRGLSYRCKDCAAIQCRKMYLKSRKKRLIYAHKYRMANADELSKKFRQFRKGLPPGELNRRRYHYMKKYKETNPLKAKCRSKYHNAIAVGKLIRQPCQFCGKKKTEGHHTDYSKHLDVMWLCRSHHMAWHRVFQVAQ